MGDIADLHSRPVPPDDEVSPELVADLVRYAEGLLTEKFIRRKYRFDESTWQSLGNNEGLIEKIEEEKIRRTRDGSSKREKAQQLVVKTPAILDSIASDPAASPRHRVDAIKTLDAFAANGPESTPAADRFVISIILNSDVLHFDKSIAPTTNDPRDITPQSTIAAIEAKSDDDDG